VGDKREWTNTGVVYFNAVEAAGKTTVNQQISLILILRNLVQTRIKS